jgi:hypothetical protein
VLFQDGREVGLGHVVGEGAVAEDAGGVAGGGQRLVPGDDTLREWLYVVAADLLRQAGQQDTAADGIYTSAGSNLKCTTHT